jgi:hypothetical protein
MRACGIALPLGALLSLVLAWWLLPGEVAEVAREGITSAATRPTATPAAVQAR